MLLICLPPLRLSSCPQKGMSGQAMTKTVSPSTVLPWSPLTNPKNKAPHCSAAPDKGEGSEQSLDLCKSHVYKGASIAPFLPLSSQSQELQHQKELSLSVWRRATVMFPFRTAVLSTCFPPAQICSSFNCNNCSFYKRKVGTQTCSLWNVLRSPWRVHICYLIRHPLSSTAMNLWGKSHSLPRNATRYYWKQIRGSSISQDVLCVEHPKEMRRRRQGAR